MLRLLPTQKSSHRLVSVGSSRVKMFPRAAVSVEDMEDDRVWRQNNVATYNCCKARKRGFFFFLLGKQNCRDKQTLPDKVKTQHLRWVLKYWLRLAAIGRHCEEDGAVSAGSRAARWDPGSIMHAKRMRLNIYWVFMLQNRKCGAPLLKPTDC